MNSFMVRAAAVLVVLAFGQACGTTLHPMPDNPVTDPLVLLARMKAHGDGFDTLSAVARMKSESSYGVVRGRITVLARMDGKLRVDGWTPTDSLVATLTAGPEEFNYFERGADECLTGRSCPENLALFLPVGMEVRPTVGFLFGLPPIDPSVSDWTIEFDRKSGAYKLTAPAGKDRWQRIWIREDGVPVAADLRNGKDLVYRIEASGFETVSGRVFPMNVNLRASRYDTSLEIGYRSVDLEPVIDERDWEFKCPEGMGVHTVHCGGW